MSKKGFQATVVQTHGEPPQVLVFTGGVVVAHGVLNNAGFLADRVVSQTQYPELPIDEMNEVAERAAKAWRTENASQPIGAGL